MRENISRISNEDILVMPADILVPAALGGVLTAEIARQGPGEGHHRSGQCSH